MKDLIPPKRVNAPGEKQELQKKLKTLDAVPPKYRSFPGFDDLASDPAHGMIPEPKTIREAVSAVEAVLSGALTAPVTRADDPYIDFYDGHGHPVDVKTPLSPAKGDKWEFDPLGNAETILKQLEMTHKNRLTGKEEPVTVLLDSTYLSREDHAALWHKLRKLTKDDRSKLNAITEVCARFPSDEKVKSPVTAAILMNKIQGR